MTSMRQDCEMVKSGSEKKSGHTYKQWLFSILVATTLLNYGLQNGWISPMKKVLQSKDSPSGTPLTDIEMSWVASTMSLSAVFGVLLYAYIADTYGRRVGVIAMVIPQAICWIVKLTSARTPVLIIGRIFAGIPAGGCFNLVPMYVKEISEDHNRGILVALAVTFQNVGSFAMYAMGSYLDYYTVLYIVVCIPIAAAILLMIIAPESPAFLVKVGNIEGAARTVANLRGLDIDDHAVQKEIENMKIEEENYKAAKNISLLSIFKNEARLRAFLLCTFIMTALDLNGTFTINSYAWTIMSESGVSSPELQTLSIPATMIFGSLVSIICVEKFGRKPILVGGFALGTVALTCLGTSLLLQQRGGLTLPGWVPVLAMVVSMWSYAAGVLPMTYVILAEIFQFHVRAKLIGGIVMYGWLVTAIQLFSYQPITDAFGMYTTFFVYATVNLVGAVVCLIFVPETMGKSVDEIESVLLKKRVQL